MFLIRTGERSPRVVLIQIMLNRQGASLVVDGIFGSKTHTAVTQFQRRKGLKVGAVGPKTWAELSRDARETVVDVLDFGDPKMAGPVESALRQAGSDPIVLGLMCNGVGQMVVSVAGQCTGPRTLALLRITGHGNLGRWMTVSVGDLVGLLEEGDQKEYNVREAEYYSYINLKHFPEVAPILTPLKTLFAPFGSMEHTGCSIGSRPESRQMMQKMADLWGVPVSAGIHIQHSVLNFDGAVFTAYPGGGTLASWSRQFQKICV